MTKVSFIILAIIFVHLQWMDKKQTQRYAKNPFFKELNPIQRAIIRLVGTCRGYLIVNGILIAFLTLGGLWLHEKISPLTGRLYFFIWDIVFGFIALRNARLARGLRGFTMIRREKD